jgi:hypothetical protein
VRGVFESREVVKSITSHSVPLRSVHELYPPTYSFFHFLPNFLPNFLPTDLQPPQQSEESQGEENQREENQREENQRAQSEEREERKSEDQKPEGHRKLSSIRLADDIDNMGLDTKREMAQVLDQLRSHGSENGHGSEEDGEANAGVDAHQMIIDGRRLDAHQIISHDEDPNEQDENQNDSQNDSQNALNQSRQGRQQKDRQLQRAGMQQQILEKAKGQIQAKTAKTLKAKMLMERANERMNERMDKNARKVETGEMEQEVIKTGSAYWTADPGQTVQNKGQNKGQNGESQVQNGEKLEEQLVKTGSAYWIANPKMVGDKKGENKGDKQGDKKAEKNNGNRPNQVVNRSNDQVVNQSNQMSISNQASGRLPFQEPMPMMPGTNVNNNMQSSRPQIQGTPNRMPFQEPLPVSRAPAFQSAQKPSSKKKTSKNVQQEEEKVPENQRARGNGNNQQIQQIPNSTHNQQIQQIPNNQQQNHKHRPPTRFPRRQQDSHKILAKMVPPGRAKNDENKARNDAMVKNNAPQGIKFIRKKTVKTQGNEGMPAKGLPGKTGLPEKKEIPEEEEIPGEKEIPEETAGNTAGNRARNNRRAGDNDSNGNLPEASPNSMASDPLNSMASNDPLKSIASDNAAQSHRVVSKISSSGSSQSLVDDESLVDDAEKSVESGQKSTGNKSGNDESSSDPEPILRDENLVHLEEEEVKQEAERKAEQQEVEEVENEVENEQVMENLEAPQQKPQKPPLTRFDSQAAPQMQQSMHGQELQAPKLLIKDPKIQRIIKEEGGSNKRTGNANGNAYGNNNQDFQEQINSSSLQILNGEIQTVPESTDLGNQHRFGDHKDDVTGGRFAVARFGGGSNINK